MGIKTMKTEFGLEDRKKLEADMATVFSERIQGLSKELQEILLDDMVTALENRIKVMTIASTKYLPKKKNSTKKS